MSFTNQLADQMLTSWSNRAPESGAGVNKRWGTALTPRSSGDLSYQKKADSKLATRYSSRFPNRLGDVSSIRKPPMASRKASVRESLPKRSHEKLPSSIEAQKPLRTHPCSDSAGTERHLRRVGSRKTETAPSASSIMIHQESLNSLNLPQPS